MVILMMMGSGSHSDLRGMIMFCLVFFSSFLGMPVMFSAASSLDETNMMMNPVVELSSRDELVYIAGYGEEKLSKVTISGRVVCHDACGGAAAAADHHQSPTPISGAAVAVFCGSSGKWRKSWARGTTDEYGDFLIDLPSHLHAIPNLEKVCLLKVLHLPHHSACRPAFRGKHKGIQLRSIDDGGARIYSANTINLTTKPSRINMARSSNRKQMKHVH